MDHAMFVNWLENTWRQSWLQISLICIAAQSLIVCVPEIPDRSACASSAKVVSIGYLESDTTWKGFGCWAAPNLKALSDERYCYVDARNTQSADLIVSPALVDVKKYLENGDSNQKFIVWTDEPRLDITTEPVAMVRGKSVPVYNVYTAKVLFNNYYFLDVWFRRGIYGSGPLEKVSAEILKNKKNMAVMLATYGIGAYYTPNMVKEDLALPRTQLALYGHKLGFVDIFGKNWPDGISKEDTRFVADWENRKEKIVRDYKFNICFDNTYIKYYTSEKIWDAIRSYSLPIYKGSDWIYEDFPKDSFVDANNFDSEQELFDFIKAMSDDEWIRRMNVCVDVYNKSLAIVKKTDVHRQRDGHLKKVLDNLMGSN